MDRRKSISILLAAVIAMSGVVYLLTTRADADGPKFVGQMQKFTLADRTASRPQLSWLGASGQKISLSDFNGKVVLLNYWSTWCLPCRRELPSMDRLQAKLAGDNFTVIALNIDRGGKSDAQRVADSLTLKHLKLNLDPRNITVAKLGLRVMPTSYLFDRTGRLIGTMEGEAEWDTAEAINLIQYYIDRPNRAE